MKVLLAELNLQSLSTLKQQRYHTLYTLSQITLQEEFSSWRHFRQLKISLNFTKQPYHVILIHFLHSIKNVTIDSWKYKGLHQEYDEYVCT